MYSNLASDDPSVHYMGSPEGGFNMMPPRYTGLPNSANTLMEQIELGGAKIEEILQQMNFRYQALFFVASLLVIFSATFGLLGSIFSFELSNIVNSTFLQIFGVTMLLLDVPGNPQWASRYRSLIRKYVRFLTRLTGKALWFLFLGCLCATTLWPTHRGGGGALLFAVITSFPVVVISFVGFMIALRRSFRLEKVRKSILSTKSNLVDIYNRYAATDRDYGMQIEEFNRLSSDHTGGKIQFDISDLGIIYSALDDHQKCAINEKEFLSWMTGSMTFL